jgi:hypothetical protein
MATDQEIRDAGFKYIPQQKYLQNPFEIPTAPTVNIPPPGQTGILATNAGDNFSVYNMDPNRIANMNPNRYALQDARYDNELSYVGSPNFGYTSPTHALKTMETYPEYYGIDTIGDRFELDEKGELVMDSEGNYIRKNQPSKISQLISKGIGFIPGIGTLSRIGNFAAGLLPVNRRSIMENQLGVSGVMVDDIGRIVVGPGGSYRTPEGVMAGYNVAKMTDKTFTNRQAKLRETLKNKGLNDNQIDGIISGELDEDDFSLDKYPGLELANTKKVTNLITDLRNIEIARKNFSDADKQTDTIFDIKTDTKTNDRNGKTGGGGKKYTGGGGSGVPDQISGGGGVQSGMPSSSPTNVGNPFGYMSGGRVNFKNGGLASIL